VRSLARHEEAAGQTDPSGRRAVPRIEEISCKQALNRVEGMPFRWSLNPYRGCQHACVYCLSPDTLILYADLVWRPIGDASVGDELVGFDEEPTELGYRYLRRSVVEAVCWSRRPTRRIITDRGEVAATADHRWLRQGRDWWVRTRNLRPGGRLRLLPIEQPAEVACEDYRTGYITGVTVGDDTFRYEPGQRSNRPGYPSPYWRVAMADREPLLRLTEYLAGFGVEVALRPFAGPSARREMQQVNVQSIGRLATIHNIVTTERSTPDYYRGFLAGFYDAEGSNGLGSSVRLHQKDQSILDRVLSYSERLGLSWAMERRHHPERVHTARLTGSFLEQLQFFQLCRPAIVRKHTTLWNKVLRLDAATIEAVERGPQADVVDIQTSTRTFFAAGLASHNCFARSTHAYLQLGLGEDFSGVIFAKTNVAEALAGELGRRSWRREQVAIGTATDPYQPVEGSYRLTRGCLEVLRRFRTPASIVTKGTLIVRDLELLAELADVAGLTVCHSVPTVDEELWRRTEPGTPPPRQRLRAMQRLREAGVRAGVLMAPLLPGLSARPELLEQTARAAAEHGACFLGANVLHLGPGVREHYLEFVGREFPELLAEYRRLYPGRYAPKWFQDELRERVRRLREPLRLGERYGPAREPAPVPTQLRLAL
jgi:DNA repair photolyase